MAPAGPPSDSPDPPDERRDRVADDWDWGGDWDDPAAPGPAVDADADDPGPRTPTRRGADDPGPRTPARAAAAGSAPRAPDASGPAPGRIDRGRRNRGEGAPAPTSPGGSGPTRRRRPAVVAVAGVVALLLGVVGASALTGGDDGSAPASATDGDALRSLVGVAARATRDEAERAAAIDRYARIGRPIYCGAGRKPWVALTFDDGPGPLSPRWIALMAEERVPMTLFRIGRNVPGNEEYVRVQRNLGWDSGSHTQNHPALASLSAAEQRREIVRGEAAGRRVLGRPVRLFRPPYESHDAATDRIVEDRGMVEVLWNVDTEDALGSTSADEIVRSATRGMKPGSIILMHEVKPNTLAAMPRIIAALREKHLEPVTVSRMLAGDGPDEAQLRKGYAGCPVDVTPGRAAS